MYLDTTYGEVMGSAHNSGGSVEATLEAIIFGADVIEADVVEIDGQLYTAHTPPLPIIGPRFFRGPPSSASGQRPTARTPSSST